MLQEFFYPLYPVPQYRKIRHEGQVLVAMNQNLEIIYLNDTSGFFLEKADGRRTIGELLQCMQEAYDVEMDVLQMDIFHLVRDLQWNKLITLSKSRK